MRKHLTNPRLTGQTIALSRTGKYALLRNRDKKKSRKNPLKKIVLIIKAGRGIKARRARPFNGKDI